MKMTLAEKINRARGGLSQSYIITKMNQMGCKISDSQFSRKKNGHKKFSESERLALKTLIGLEC
jgi:hypothetical protein